MTLPVCVDPSGNIDIELVEAIVSGQLAS